VPIRAGLVALRNRGLLGANPESFGISRQQRAVAQNWTTQPPNADPLANEVGDLVMESAEVTAAVSHHRQPGLEVDTLRLNRWERRLTIMPLDYARPVPESDVALRVARDRRPVRGRRNVEGRGAGKDLAVGGGRRKGVAALPQIPRLWPQQPAAARRQVGASRPPSR
jgi:hypothetical protein